MILIRTHSNRWVARERRDRPVTGIITLINPGERRAVYRTESVDIGSGERALLRDSDALEVAFALLLARRARAAAEREAAADDAAQDVAASEDAA